MLPYFSKIWKIVTDRRLLIFLYIFHLLYMRDIAIDIFSSEQALAIFYKFGWFLVFYVAFDMLVELFSRKLIIKKQQEAADSDLDFFWMGFYLHILQSE